MFGLQQEVPSAEVLRLFAPSGCQLKAVTLDGSSAPEGMLSECRKLPALQLLHVMSGSGVLVLANTALPQLCTLNVGGRWGGGAPGIGLQLVRAALPALQTLSFASSGSSLSLQHLALPALRTLIVRASSSACITHAVLPALQSLNVVCSGSVQLACDSMPCLAQLMVHGSPTGADQPLPALNLADMEFPALPDFQVVNCSLNMQRVSMPALRTLTLTTQPSWSAADVVLPALRRARLCSIPEGNLSFFSGGWVRPADRASCVSL